MDTPVILIVFNRPDLTARTFAAVRKARPPKLLIIADGPRADRPDDVALCQSTLEIVEAVDWPCEVLREYATENMGCGRRISSGLTWAFEQVESAIILEDDCIPDPTFFDFCNVLLNHYAEDDRVMMISGTNFQKGIQRGEGSYYFSRYPNIWGWATWRRSWEKFDFGMERWAELRRTDWLRKRSSNAIMSAYWRFQFDCTTEGRIDNWGYPWIFSFWCNEGLSIVPNVNLIVNEGFREDGTHTTGGLSPTPAAQSIKFPLTHPKELTADLKADLLEDYTRWLPMKSRIRFVIKELLRPLHRLLSRH